MSSTSNSQNLLVNVFRPTYVYDETKGYIPKLVLSNVDSIAVMNVTVSNLNIGDANSNIYLGSNAGNSNTLVTTCNTSNVTAIGISAGNNNSNCDNTVFIGNSSGINTSNVDNSVYVGALTGSGNLICANSVYIGYNIASNLSNVSNQVVIGANAIAGENSNVYVGSSTGSTGGCNVFIGPGINGFDVSGQVRIGIGGIIPFFADIFSGCVGINNTSPQYPLDVAGDGYFSGKIGIQTVPIKSLDVNGQTRSTGGFLSQQGELLVETKEAIGQIKTGMIMVSVVDIDSSLNSAGGLYLGTSISNMTPVSVSSSGDTSITTNNGTDIAILNANGPKTYMWNITYFPTGNS